MQEFPNKFGFSVSHTTRGPRTGEENGVHYHFVSREIMARKIQEGDFIEHAEVHGNSYGTSVETVQQVIMEGKCCILDVDVQGAQQIRQSQLKQPFIIFIRPPSIEDLESRLRGRGTEQEDRIQVRLANARKEMAFMNDKNLFDKVIVNNDLESCYQEFKTTILSHLKL
jgi:guanylate kinase